MNTQNTVEIVSFHPGPVNYRGVQTGTISVRGVTRENYHSNRVFMIDGKRWVLQGWFGGGGGESFYVIEQHN
jgi:hypothetical protein